MKLIEPPTARLADFIRSLLYPVIPILGVISIWAYAYAGSLESKVKRQLHPRGEGESYYLDLTNPSISKRPAILVTSIDDDSD